jgi:hypothetical protein
MHQEWSPMMPAYPTSSPSTLSVTLLAAEGTRYLPERWLTSTGVPHGSVRYDARSVWFTIQGAPAALRELAAALMAAAELADPSEPAPDPDPVRPVAEGVSG